MADKGKAKDHYEKLADQQKKDGRKSDHIEKKVVPIKKGTPKRP